jgi:flagellar hook-basal body complex protein FliE
MTGIGGINPVSSGFPGSISPVGGDGGGSGMPGMDMPAPGGDQAGGGTFADMLKEITITQPSKSHATADALATQFAAGGNVDPHKLAIATAQAGVEIQVATRTISQAATAVRTLMQTQI